MDVPYIETSYQPIVSDMLQKTHNFCLFQSCPKNSLVKISMSKYGSNKHDLLVITNIMHTKLQLKNLAINILWEKVTATYLK